MAELLDPAATLTTPTATSTGLRVDVAARLEDCAALKELYEEIGPIHPDTMLSARHNKLDHFMGPQLFSNIFSSPPRWRPHDDRVLTETYDPLFCVQGMTRITGTAWLTGMLFGGVQGFYRGLKSRDQTSRSWRSAYLALWNFSFHHGPRRANTFAAIAFTFTAWESFARYMVMANQQKLRFKEKGLILGRFGSADDDDLQLWQRDGRYCAPVGAAAAAVTLRALKGGAKAQYAVMVTNGVLAAAATTAVVHLWDSEDYFDITKTMRDLVDM